ncbi:MAG: hypothetical protein COU40_02295 [Candidatus Moranbacteria bacterium CG10_big_fil_rev_8_21_14_0_10_35_21]|nr:MAG: hypothetical protein COU40_02295 [Candidatus Moranbacteria bacterium CG10_big_fil_rev_8_21_14_0_10_35_21]PJA88937.1 MAG: hypothetical protein CO139_00540 [Candidatus Moranbacteria bacterium CG_4_9_14_3_um_filter_36_9]
MEKGGTIKHDLNQAPKTGDWRYMRPVVDEKKCTACGTCVKFCPEAVISLETRSPKPITQKKDKKYSYELRDMRCANIDYDFCKGCGVCEVVCSVKAIIMKKE